MTPFQVWPYSVVKDIDEVSTTSDPPITQDRVDEEEDEADKVKKKNLDIFIGFLVPTLLVFIVICILAGMQYKKTGSLAVPRTPSVPKEKEVEMIERKK